MVAAAVDAEIVEEETLGEAVSEALFGNLGPGRVLGSPHGHGLELGERRAASGRVLRSVTDDEVAEEIRTLEHDAASRRRGGELTEIAKELAFDELLAERARAVVDRLLRELDDRAGLDPSPGIDVMADPGRRWAKRLSLTVVVGVDDDDRLSRSHLDDETARAELLLGREAKLGRSGRPHRPVDVEPRVEDAHLDQPIDPCLGEKVVDVRLAKAGADAGEKPVSEAALEARER